MIWAVLDTNTLVSGLGWPKGPPGQIIDRAIEGGFVVVTSTSLLEEFGRVIRYPKLAEAFPDPMPILLLVETMSALVEPSATINMVADAEDNRVLEAAITAHADFIVTGDDDLLELDVFEGTQIVKPKAFLTILEAD